METTPHINLSCYKFLPLSQFEETRVELKELGERLDLLGCIILSPEGLNVAAVGTRPSIDELKAWLENRYGEMFFKESLSSSKPFKRFLVKIKDEIIPVRRGDIKPGEYTGPSVDPETLKQWLDEGKDLVLLDTRNDYETDHGTFEGAVDLQIKNFMEFGAKAVEALPNKDKPVVMFCTGGVRCEKASVMLEKEGYTNVYQLHGGILNYFEKCGGAHWDGNCFVFDQRVAVRPDLSPMQD